MDRKIYSIREIRMLFQKPFHQEEPYAWLVSRRISALVTFGLQRTSIRPNTITIGALAVGVISGGLLVSDSLLLQILAVLGIQLWYVLDCVDGEVARIREDFSNLGVYLDYLMHYFVDAAVLTAIAIRTVRLGLAEYWTILMILGTVAVILGRVLNDLSFRLLVESQQGSTPARASRLSRSYSNLLNKIVGVYPRPGYVWHSVPMYLAVSGAVVLGFIINIDLVVHVAGLYSLAHIVSLGLRLVGIVATGRIESGRWLIELESKQE